jgi:hypothetical protein
MSRSKVRVLSPIDAIPHPSGEMIMKKLCLLICLVVVSSLCASATNRYNVILNHYCDMWFLTVDNGVGPYSTATFVWGTHDELQRCGVADWDTIGQQHTVAKDIPPNDVFGTSGAVLDISDASLSPEPVEYLIRCTKKKYAGAVAVYTGGASSGGSFFVGEDTATCNLPVPGPLTQGGKTLASR